MTKILPKKIRYLGKMTLEKKAIARKGSKIQETRYKLNFFSFLNRFNKPRIANKTKINPDSLIVYSGIILMLWKKVAKGFCLNSAKVMINVLFFRET